MPIAQPNVEQVSQTVETNQTPQQTVEPVDQEVPVSGGNNNQQWYTIRTTPPASEQATTNTEKTTTGRRKLTFHELLTQLTLEQLEVLYTVLASCQNRR